MTFLTRTNLELTIPTQFAFVPFVLHGFDVSSPIWNTSSDGADYYQPKGSRYVWIENCTATNFGDDGFTTHYSEYIYFTNCHAYNANGSAHDKGSSNSNGFEIDDGSRILPFG